MANASLSRPVNRLRSAAPSVPPVLWWERWWLQARTRLVKALNVKDAFIAVPEDSLTIVCAYILISI